MIAYALVWAALFAYLFAVAGSVRALRQEMAELRQLVTGNSRPAESPPEGAAAP